MRTSIIPAAVLIPAAAYCRASSADQTESVPAQRQELERYAAAHGYRIVKWFVDDGISGARDDREAFRELIADAERGAGFKCILVWDQDRFSRFDALEANHYWFILRRAGVFIESIRQGKLDFDTLAGWLTASITQVGKHDFLKSLSANVKRGKARAHEAGKFAGGATIYGYEMQRTAPDSRGMTRLDGKPQPHPEAAQVVAEIFKKSSEGATAFAIARELNERKVTSPGKLIGTAPNGKWTTRQVVVILRRKEYATGQYRIGAAIVHCEPLVSREIFDAAHRRAAKRISRSPRKEGNFPLTGLAFCATCGSPLNGTSVGAKNRYMRCSGANRAPGAVLAPSRPSVR